MRISAGEMPEEIASLSEVVNELNKKLEMERRRVLQAEKKAMQVYHNFANLQELNTLRGNA